MSAPLKRVPAQAADRVRRRVRRQIQALTAYSVPPAEGLVKLDAMENPYQWPEAMTSAWLKRIEQVSLNRYPDPTAADLVARLRNHLTLPDDLAVLLGNGSDELIQMIALALAGQPILAPQPSFVMYKLIAETVGSPFVPVPLTAGFALDREAMLAAIVQHDPGVVFLAYPNNPTGNLFDQDTVEAVINTCDGLVVMDEAYHVFTQTSFLEAVRRYDNVVVLRTLSKLGLAGLRLGWLLGPPAWLEEFNKVRLPYNINVLTQASVAFTLEHNAVFEEQATRIRAERTQLSKALSAREGITVYPSAANFLLFRTERIAPTRLFDGLLQRKVLIKNLHAPGTSLENCLRVTVGTADENNAFLTALDAVLAE